MIGKVLEQSNITINTRILCLLSLPFSGRHYCGVHYQLKRLIFESPSSLGMRAPVSPSLGDGVSFAKVKVAQWRILSDMHPFPLIALEQSTIRCQRSQDRLFLQ